MLGSDKQVEFFLQLKEEFENVHIDTVSSVDEDINETMLNQISENWKELEVLQLKYNVLPRGFVPL